MLRYCLVGATRLTLTGLNQDEDVVHAHSQYKERDHLHDNECGSHAAETEDTDGAHHRCENDQHSWGNIINISTQCKIYRGGLNNFIQKRFIYLFFLLKNYIHCSRYFLLI